MTSDDIYEWNEEDDNLNQDQDEDTISVTSLSEEECINVCNIVSKSEAVTLFNRTIDLAVQNNIYSIKI